MTNIFRSTEFTSSFRILLILTLSLVYSLSPALTRTAQAQPVFSSVFGPDMIGAGGTSTLTYTIDNSSSGANATDLAFTNTLPPAITLANPSSVSTTCVAPLGGAPSLSAPDGGTTITFSNGAVTSGSSCNVTVNVTASTLGTHTNTTGNLTSNFGSLGTATDILEVVATRPSFSKAFAPSMINQNGISTLTYTMDNTANTGRVGSLDFTEILPAGLVVASPSNATTDCISATAPDTTLTAVPGSSNISLDANGNIIIAGFEVLSAGATCSVSLDVQATGVGALTATSGDLLADFVSVGPSTATLMVSGNDLLLSQSFINDPVVAGNAATLEFTIDNNDRNFSATAVGFTNDLTTALAGLTFDSVVSNSCGGSVSGVGTTNISYSGGVVAAQANCAITVSLTVPAGAASGSYVNTTGAVSATVNGSPVTGNTSNGTLNVQSVALAAPSLAMSFSDADPGDVSTATFTVTNNATGALTNGAFLVEIVPPLPFPASIGLPTTPDPACGSGSGFSLVFLDAEQQGLQLTGGALAASGAGGDSCTFSVGITLPNDVSPGTYSFTSGPVSGSVGGASVTGGTANANLTVGGGVAVDLAKSFDTANAQPSTTVGLTFSITNRAESSGTATNISFSDNLDAFSAGSVLTSIESNDCGVTPTGTSTITVAGLDLAPGASCSISTTITLGAGIGSFVNTTSAPTAGLNNGAESVAGSAATADLTVSTDQPLVFTHEYIDDPFVAGAAGTLRYSIMNPNASTDATITFFTHNLSAEVAGLAASSVPASPCGGSLSGTNFLILVGGNVVGGDTCTFDVPITIPSGAVDGIYNSVTSALASSLGNTDPSAASFTIESTALRLFKTFGADNAFAGSAVELSFTVENASTQAVTSLAFSDDLENDFLSGAIFLGQNSNTCGGSLAGQATGALDFTGGALGAGASCQISINVQLPVSAVAGDYTNTSSFVSADAGGNGVTGDAASDDLRIFSSATPTLSKSFDGPTTAGGTAELTFTITNPSTTLPISNLGFTDDLSAMVSGAVASTTPSAPCGAGSSLSGTNVLSLSGGTIAPLGSCIFSVTVVMPSTVTAGTYTNVTSQLFQNGIAVAPTASASVDIEPAPAFAKAFSPSTITQGENSALTFTIDNSGSSLAATSLAFTDTVPSALFPPVGGAQSSTCGGSLSYPIGATAVTFSGGSVGAGATCVVSVEVSATTVGAHVNTTGNLTSSSGNSGTASATLNVTAAPAPSFTKAFSAGSIAQGGVDTLTFTINNTAAIAATGLAFGDTFPTGMVIAATPNNSTTCTGGSGTFTAGAGSLSFSGGSVDAGSSCTVSVDVTSSTIGGVTNTSGTLASSLGTSPAASAGFTVTAAPIPSFSQSIAPASIVQGGVATLTFTISNATALIAADNLALSNTLPAGVTVAATPNVVDTCNGTATAAPGGSVVSYSGGTVVAGASCTLSIDVTSSTVGMVTNTSGALSTTLGNSGTSSAPLTVTAAPAPSFVKAFGPSSIVQGATSTLTFTIDNAAALVDASALDFTDTLPAGMTVATVPNASTTCTGGTLSASTGAGAISYTGGTVGSASSCTIAVDVTSATLGVSNNTSGALTSSLGSSGTAAASLSVTAAPVPTFAKAFGAASIVQGATSTLIFTIDNTSSLIAASALDFVDMFPTGMTVAATPNASSTCIGGTITAVAGASSANYRSGSVGAGATCTVSMDVTSSTIGNAVNVSGALSSSLGASGTASDTLTVTAAAAPSFSKAFGPSSIEQGATSTLTFTIDNAGILIDATSLDFTDNFPAGMTVASTPNASTTCTGGTLSATAGAALASYTGGTVGAGASCTVSLDVTSATVGNAVNTSGDLTSSQGSSGTASDTLTVTAATAPSFSKAFGPSTIVQGGISTLTFTIDNSASLVDATSLDFTDSFPTGVTVASAPNSSTTCTGGALTATAGSGSIGYTGGTVSQSASCTVSVDVTGVSVGSQVNTTGDLTSSLGNSGTASATLSVTSAPLPSFAKAFSPSTITSGGTSRLTFTISNASALIPATSLSFTDTFPANMLVAAVPNVASTCGGASNVTANSNRISLTGGSVSAGSSCTLALDVTAFGSGTLVNTSGDLTSSIGNSGTATASLNVNAAVTGQVTIIQLSDVDNNFGFTSPEAALNFTIATVSGGGSEGPISLPAGQYSVTQTRPSGFGNTSLVCSDANSVGVSGTGELTLNLEAGESLTCTFASVDSVSPTREAINDFLNRRINQILSHEPSNGRRIGRLKRGFGGSRAVSFSRGDLNSLAPVNFDLKSLGTNSYSISGSLAQAQAAIARHPLALDGSATDTTRVDNHRFDVWFEASYSRFEGSQGSEGHFGIAYLGADYLLNEDVLIGFMVQYDDIKDQSSTLNRVTEGSGWMAGPYITARLSENLYFDGRFAVGQSRNHINLDLDGTTGFANGNFSTDRWLIDASLVGDFDLGKWHMQPDISVSYMEETQQAFVDSLNVFQPKQTVSQGQIRFGPNFSRRFEAQNGVVYEPSFSLDGIYNFGNGSSTSTTATVDDTKGFRGRLEAGVVITNRNNTRVELNVHTDGLGKSNYESYGARLRVAISF